VPANLHWRLQATGPMVRNLFSWTAFFATLFALPVRAQNLAEAAGANSVAASAAVEAKPPHMPSLPASRPVPTSPHLIASSQPPADETNRRTLSENAGKDPSKLLIRSTAKDSQIWVDGKPVGRAPLLLVLAPGKYHIESRGPRSEYGQRTVDLLSRETREVTLELEKRYPSRVTVH